MEDKMEKGKEMQQTNELKTPSNHRSMDATEIDLKYRPLLQ